MLNIYNYITNTAQITVDAGQVQTYIEDAFKSIFGNNLNVDTSTPQGMLIQAFTLMFIGLSENNASLANQINRNIAGGTYLDSDAALFGIQRIAGIPSTVYATISGVAGTFIAAQSQASETVNGAVFATLNDVTIPSSGTIANVEFQSWSNLINPPSYINGPIPCAANTLTQIISNITGWESVINPDSAIEGVLQQSDVNFNNTINKSLSNQSIGSLGSITAKLYTTPGVNSVYPLENVEETTQTIQGVSMVHNSIYYCIDYTCSDEDIATAFTKSKGTGCSYNNGPGINKSYVYTAPISSQPITILWDSPSIINIQIEVTISELTSLQDPTTSVQNAVLSYAAGKVPLMPGFTVGTNVSPSQISAAIAQQIPGVFVQEVQVGIISFTKQGTLTISENTVSGMTYTSDLTIGMGVSGTGIPSMTTISSITNDNDIVLSNDATVTGEKVLTFTQSVSFSTETISISAWQKASTIASYITVSEV